MYRFIAWLLRLYRGILFRASIPGPITGLNIVLEGPSSMKVVVTFPPAIAPDMAKRTLVNLKLDDVALEDQELGINATQSNIIEAKRGQFISGQLIDHDTSRNQSVPRDFKVEVRDTTAPPQPGEIAGCAVLDENDAVIPPPPVDPPVEDPVVVDPPKPDPVDPPKPDPVDPPKPEEKK